MHNLCYAGPHKDSLLTKLFRELRIFTIHFENIEAKMNSRRHIILLPIVLRVTILFCINIRLYFCTSRALPGDIDLPRAGLSFIEL